MVLLLLPLLSAFFSAAVAAPALCPLVTSAVNAAHQQSSATAFCSSYLSISAKTTTVTTTNTVTATASPVTTTYTTITATASPSTVLLTASTTSTTTSTSTSVTTTTVTSTTTSNYNCAAPTTPGSRKRAAAAAKPKPSALNPYTASALLSSACSCLSIPTPTSTVTSTVSKTATVTPTSSIASLTTATPIVSSTTTITSVITTSASTVSTSTVVSTTTAYGPFSIVASGGAVNGQYASAATGENANVYFNTDAADATIWELDGNGDLIEESGSVGYIANEDEGDGEYIVYLNDNDTIIEAGYVYLQCTVAINNDGTCPMTCSANGGSVSSDDTGDDNAWYVSPAGNAQSDIFTPYVVSV